MYRFDPKMLKNIIRKEGMNQLQFAKQLKISRSYLCRILSDRREPSIRLLGRLKTVFPEYSLDYFFTQTVDREE